MLGVGVRLEVALATAGPEMADLVVAALVAGPETATGMGPVGVETRDVVNVAATVATMIGDVVVVRMAAPSATPGASRRAVVTSSHRSGDRTWIRGSMSR